MTSIAQLMVDDGYALVEAATMRENLAPFGELPDWAAFAASWNGMPQDTYMADGGRYRRRLHAVFSAAAGEAAIHRAPHRAHYQARDYNTLNGGVARMFAPVETATTQTESFRTVLAFSRALFDDLQPDTSWDIEMHQFRIESRAGEVGQPTPEGLHRDGVDYVLVLLIERVNIASGVTTIHALDKRLLGSFTLATPLDAALVHDREVYHGVTAVQPLDPALPAHRDVLVLTFRAV
jgi:hypothetical protein